VTVTALGGASAGRRFFDDAAGNVIPANISGLAGLIATGRLAIDIVLLQLSGPDAAHRCITGLGIEHDPVSGSSGSIEEVIPLVEQAIHLGGPRDPVSAIANPELDSTPKFCETVATHRWRHSPVDRLPFRI